jgi:hypothetical protein
MSSISNKHERMYQIYSWYKTARLNVLYYEESLKHWKMAVRIHDIIIAIGGASSPIAFWQHSEAPLQKQVWFYLTLFAAFSALLKPIFRWENQVKLFAELETHYCDLYLDMKSLLEDIAASQDLGSKHNSLFEHHRASFKELERKEPPQNRAKTIRLEKRVNEEINIDHCWFPPEERGINHDIANPETAAPAPASTG